MPPKRKSPVATAAAPAMPPRMTRSMAAGKRGADAPAKKEEAEAAPAAAGGKGRKKAKKEVSAVETVLSPPAAAKQKVKKNAKKEVVAAAVDDGGAGAESGKRVIVEAWTKWISQTSTSLHLQKMWTKWMKKQKMKWKEMEWKEMKLFKIQVLGKLVEKIKPSMTSKNLLLM
ncbi:uncharacterized protein [Triticum aestivum]|uniref:uncharacterized protein n=1 Tax=Triticum aestivum TaxID=4565 RepID=UPI001D02BEF7|nr:uncharacterized protein LOC123096799 [Triticum aestivum]